MELIEGESLADRLAQGPLPLDQALQLGIEIADALEQGPSPGHRASRSEARERDADETRREAARLRPRAASTRRRRRRRSSLLPTQQHSLTQAGTVLGTFQYMSPEQLEGSEADARTDIFAFGALLYEMVTGRKAFEGKSQASLISSIMAGTPPPITSLQPMTPPALERVIKTCLTRIPTIAGRRRRISRPS